MRLAPPRPHRGTLLLAVITASLVHLHAGAQTAPQPPTPLPPQPAPAVELSTTPREHHVPLSFPGFDATPVKRVTGFDANGRQLSASTGSIQVSDVPTEPEPGKKAAVVVIGGPDLQPTTITLNLVGDNGVLAILRLPITAPEPRIESVRFGDGAGTETLQLTPQQRVQTQVTVRGGPFFPGARIVLPAPLEVTPPTFSTDGDVQVLTATVRQPARPLHELPVGPVSLSLTNEVGGKARTLVTLLGLRPRIEVPEGVTVSVQARETVKLVVENLSDSARVEITEGQNADFEPVTVPLGDVSDGNLTFAADLGALTGLTGRASVTVVNHDNQASAPVILNLTSAARPSLSITGAEKLTPGVPALLTFAVQNSPGVRFEGLGSEYQLLVDRSEVDIPDAKPDVQGTTLRATVVLPVELAPSVGEDLVSQVNLRGPGLPTSGLNGQVSISALPLIESPKEITLRPGESRAFAVQGRRLARLELRGTSTVQVTAQDMKQEIGTATVQALRTAQPGTVQRVEGFRDAQGAGLNVRIASWLDYPQLAQGARYQSGTGELQRFSGADTLEVSPRREMRFSIAPIETLPAEGELIRAQIVREGTVVWQDSALVLPGASGDFRRSFTPGDVFAHGQEFTLTMTGQGGAYIQQRFRLRYERGFRCNGCARVHTGVSAVQIPLGRQARDRYGDGLFSGVTLGVSFPFDEAANYWNSDFLRVIALFTASEPPALPAEDTEGEAASLGSIGAQQEGGDEEDREGLAFGLSGGVLLWETLFFTAGWDTRGDDFRDGLVFSFGGTIDLSSIPGLLRRR